MARAPRLPQGGPRRLVVEVAGVCRGDLRPAAYGAVVRDALGGDVLDAEGRVIGPASDEVAAYAGLIAGLEMARAIEVSAAVEVRMDAEAIVEQLAGRRKVTQPEARQLADEARSLCPAETTWTRVTRKANRTAGQLAKDALDGRPRPRTSI